jgi:hypothetical protein
MNINQLTIDCLTNKKRQCRKIDSTAISTSDALFYKPRLFKLTNKLLNSDKPVNTGEDVLSHFGMYVEACIRHFKTTDTHDILQEPFSCEVDQDTSMDVTASFSKLQPDYVDNIKPIRYSMSKFVVKTKTTKDIIDPPRVKEITLYKEELKYKECGTDSNVLINDDELIENSLDNILPYKYFVEISEKPKIDNKLVDIK